MRGASGVGAGRASSRAARGGLLVTAGAQAHGGLAPGGAGRPGRPGRERSPTTSEPARLTAAPHPAPG